MQSIQCRKAYVSVNVRYCPLCGSEIDRDIWETMIIPAVELLNKANRAIIAKHAEENTTPIYIDVIADHFTRDDMQDDSRKDYLP